MTENKLEYVPQACLSDSRDEVSLRSIEGIRTRTNIDRNDRVKYCEDLGETILRELFTETKLF